MMNKTSDMKSYRRQYYLENRERALEYTREYNKNNAVKKKEYYKKYYLEHKKSTPKKARVTLSDEEKKIRKQRWIDTNKDKTAKTTHEYYLNHKDHLIQKRIDSKLANPEKFVLDRARVSAKVRGLDFDLDIEDIVIPEYCPILGIKLEIRLGKGHKAKSNAVSLDRLDSSKGYVRGNVWVISHRANVMKNDASMDELVAFSRGILRLFGN